MYTDINLNEIENVDKINFNGEFEYVELKTEVRQYIIEL